eukprot:scaffold7588_cov248-Pinguiococcus_pyrenoidosus.AAC.2
MVSSALTTGSLLKVVDTSSRSTKAAELELRSDARKASVRRPDSFTRGATKRAGAGKSSTGPTTVYSTSNEAAWRRRLPGFCTPKRMKSSGTPMVAASASRRLASAAAPKSSKAKPSRLRSPWMLDTICSTVPGCRISGSARPAGHWTRSDTRQAVSFRAPSLQKFPSRQTLQDLCPVSFWNRPPGQVLHDPWPSSSWYVPLAHGVGFAALAPENIPAGVTEQLSARVAFWWRPASQAMQAVSGPVAAQGEVLLEPAGQPEQTRHDDWPGLDARVPSGQTLFCPPTGSSCGTQRQRPRHDAIASNMLVGGPTHRYRSVRWDTPLHQSGALGKLSRG